MREDPFSTPNTPPLFLLHHHHPPTQSNPHWQCAAPHLSSLLLLFISLSRPHTYRPSGFSLYTLAHMHAFTFGYFVCTLLYFFPSFPFSSSLLRHLEVLHVYGGRFTCGHIQTKTDTGPIFSALQYRCVGSGHLGPQMEQKVCVFLCVDMCLCGLGLRAKLKVGVRGWGPVVETPSRELGIYGESGKNIPTVINQTSVTQMTRNNGSFSIHVTVSPPPHSHVPPTCATAPLALTARCPMRLARRSPSEIVIPSWLIGSL